MRKTKRSKNFLISLIFNILLNFEGIIPSAVLLALHFWLNISIWWSAAALALWLLWIILWTFFIGWAGRCGNTPDMPKADKNPYSVRNQKNRDAKTTEAEQNQSKTTPNYLESIRE